MGHWWTSAKVSVFEDLGKTPDKQLTYNLKKKCCNININKLLLY